jgi:hypothetical protein
VLAVHDQSKLTTNRSLYSGKMKKIKVIFFILLLASQFVALKQKSAPDDDNLIVPGERIGPVVIGRDVDDVVQKLGKPSTIQRTFNDIVVYTYKKKGIELWFDWIDKGLHPAVEPGIYMRRGNWATEKGIRIGSSFKDVIAAYGEPDYFFTLGDRKSYDWVMAYDGIWIYISERNGPVVMIVVQAHGFKPPPGILK